MPYEPEPEVVQYIVQKIAPFDDYDAQWKDLDESELRVWFYRNCGFLEAGSQPLAQTVQPGSGNLPLAQNKNTKICQFCPEMSDGRGNPAFFDGKTKMGPWAYMCYFHFGVYGVGLGLGKGLKL